MFNKKTKLKLTDFECNLLINGMNEFRNMHLKHRFLLFSYVQSLSFKIILRHNGQLRAELF